MGRKCNQICAVDLKVPPLNNLEIVTEPLIIVPRENSCTQMPQSTSKCKKHRYFFQTSHFFVVVLYGHNPLQNYWSFLCSYDACLFVKEERRKYMRRKDCRQWHLVHEHIHRGIQLKASTPRREQRRWCDSPPHTNLHTHQLPFCSGEFAF